MNIDDYIFPNSIASPAGFSTSPPSPPSHATASAIPIQTKKDAQEHAQSHPSFPPSAPTNEGARNNEFAYVQRRLRKTSIDETKVRNVAEDLDKGIGLLKLHHVGSKAPRRILSTSTPSQQHYDSYGCRRGHRLGRLFAGTIGTGFVSYAREHLS